MTDITGATRVQHHNAITSKKIHNQWILLESNRKYVRKLNPTAGFIWERTNRPVQVQAIIRAMQKTYGLPKKQAEADVLAFIRSYRTDGLLVLI